MSTKKRDFAVHHGRIEARAHIMYQEPETVHQDSEILTWPWEIVNNISQLLLFSGSVLLSSPG